ncbi:MAG: collagen-like protein [Lachnospiraceae bacterium]|nr:collagen-like protein [Lachnospiraceae bacterium]MCM1229993.1 collagen-like protein [Ruminococcus flavefaciens]
MLKFLVKQQKIEVIEREVIASGQIAFVSLKFTFDGIWKELHKVVQFTQCDETFNLVLGTDGFSCKLPAELHAGTVKMSVFGYSADNTQALRATTVPVNLNIRSSGLDEDGTETVPPTPDLYQQLLQKIDDKAETIQNGADGKSAYEIWLEIGNSGTETDFFNSLKGEKGDTGERGLQGIQGEKGEKGDKGSTGAKGSKGDTGADGKSAYDVWLELGNNGDKSDFLNSFKGEKGDTGERGLQGIQGEKGDRGEVGADGKSAYQIWLEQGNSGTENDFFNSLKGAKGDKGDKGEKGDTGAKGDVGEQGIQGIQGEDGKSAYEVWLGLGNTGSEADFLKSLKGEKGDTGNASTETAEISARLDALTDATTNISSADSLARKIEVIRGEMNGLQNHNNDMESELRAEISALKETAHSHGNMEFLDDLQAYLASAFSAVTAKYEEADKVIKARLEVLAQTVDTLANGSQIGGKTVVFDENTYSNVFLQYNGTISSVEDFAVSHPDFFSDNTLNYSFNIFGWDSLIYTCSTTPVPLTSSSQIAMRFISGNTETGAIYLVKSESGTPEDILAKAQTDGEYTEIPMQWVLSTDYITILVPCSAITAGDYYLVWAGRSNNTHPLVKSITVMG